MKPLQVRFAATENIDDADSPLQRELPTDPIEAMRAVRTLMAHLDEKAGTDDCRGFDQCVRMLFDSDVCRGIGIQMAGFGSEAEADDT